MKDEFNRTKESNYNKKIKEFKRFDAVEYYKINEIKKMPPEIKKFKEGFNDKPVEEIKEIKNPLKEKMDIKQENNNTQQENINTNTNSIQGEEAGLSASTTTASASSSTASVVSSATLTSGVSIISAVAVVAAVGAAIVKDAPKVELLKVETGTDYLYYELDVRNLAKKDKDEDKDIYYKIKVYNGMFEEEQIILEEGIQKQIVSGLTPNRQYTISVIAGDDEYGYIEYFSYGVSTNKEEMPKAVFDITPYTDETLKVFNVDYNVFISDHAMVGYQTYLEIYYDDKLVLTRYDLDENNYFRGFLEDVNEGINISMVAYTYYYDELTNIGEFGYLVTYPENMQEAVYQSSYDLQEPLITTSDSGYVLDIDTGFESKNEKEAYIIDVYKTGENNQKLTRLTALTDDDLIQSVVGNTREISITVPANLTGVEIYFTPIKENDTSRRTYERKLIGTYSFAEYRSNEIPKANISFTDSKEDNVYNLNYQININDPFIVGDNYYAEIYKNNKLIETKSITTLNYSASVPDLYNGDKVLVKLFANVNEKLFEVETSEYVITTSFDNPIYNAELNLFDESYYVGFEIDEDYEFENVTATTTITYTDDKVNEFEAEVYGQYGDEGTFAYNDISYNISEVKSLKVKIVADGKLIKELVYESSDARVDFSEYEIDSSANVAIPYNVVLSNEQTFNSIYVDYESGSYSSQELSEKNGNILINDLNSSKVKCNVSLSYENNGFRIQKPFTHEFDLNVEVDLDYYTSYLNSQAYAYVKLSAVIDDVSIEKNIDLEFYRYETNMEGTVESLRKEDATVSYNGYYTVKLDDADGIYSIKVEPKNKLFEIDDIYVYAAEYVINSLQNGSSSVDNENAPIYGVTNLINDNKELNYIHKVINGVNHYYIVTNLDLSETQYGSYYQIIYYTYKDQNNNLKYGSINIGTDQSYELITNEDIIDMHYSLVSEYVDAYFNEDRERQTPYSLRLYEYNGTDYILTEDRQFKINKKYYIKNEAMYILATPNSLGLYRKTYPTFGLTEDETYDGYYYYFNYNQENYIKASPQSFGLYVYDNGYKLSEDTEFVKGIAYYRELDGGGYESVNPKKLGLYEYIPGTLVQATEDSFKTIRYEIQNGEFSTPNEDLAVFDDSYYYDSDNDNTIIEFIVDNDRVVQNSLSLTLDDKTYDIVLKDYSELDFTETNDFATYEIEIDGGSYLVSAFISGEKVYQYRVTFSLSGNLITYPLKNPILNYDFYPNMIMDKFDNVSIDKINKEYIICKNPMTHEEAAEINVSFIDEQYYLNVSYNDLDGIDDNNYYRVLVYADSSYSTLIDSVQGYYSSVEISIPNNYSAVYIKTEFIRNSNDRITVLEVDDIGLIKFDYIENVSVENTSDGISFNGVLHSTNLRYELITEYKDNSTPNVDSGEFDTLEFSLMASNDELASRYLLKIYDNNTNLLLNTYEYSDFITILDYEYQDETDYITLPYQINLPEGYTIGSGSLVRTDYDDADITESSGSINITKLDTNAVLLEFNLILVNSDGQSINYHIYVEKEFEITDYDFDYEIVGYNASDYYYTARYVAYDEENDKYYTYSYDENTDSYVEFAGSGDYYDENGNKAPDTAQTVLVNHKACFAVKGNFTFRVGPLVVEYSDYTINVTKSGNDFLTDSHAIPTTAVTPYQLSGSDIDNALLIPMIHHGLDVFEKIDITEYRSELFQQFTCEAEFEISFGGNTYTKTINYNPPIYYPEASDAFNGLNSSVTKNLDGTINLTIDTGYEVTDQNVGYKIYLYDGSDLNGSTIILEETELIHTSEYTFTNIANKPYNVYVSVYYYADGIYAHDYSGGIRSLGNVNTSVQFGYIYRDYQSGTYKLQYSIKPDMVDSVNGVATLNIGGIDYEISLVTGSYTAGDLPVTVSTSGDSLMIEVSNAQTGEELSGTITLQETIDNGNSYDEKTYTVSFN